MASTKTGTSTTRFLTQTVIATACSSTPERLLSSMIPAASTVLVLMESMTTSLRSGDTRPVREIRRAKASSAPRSSLIFGVRVLWGGLSCPPFFKFAIPGAAKDLDSLDPSDDLWPWEKRRTSFFSDFSSLSCLLRRFRRAAVQPQLGRNPLHRLDAERDMFLQVHSQLGGAGDNVVAI